VKASAIVFPVEERRAKDDRVRIDLMVVNMLEDVTERSVSIVW